MDGGAVVCAERHVMEHAHGAASGGFWRLAAIWFGMMAAMMAPTVWPWIQAFHRFGGGGSGATRVTATIEFALGYLTMWLGYSLAAAAAQLALHHSATLERPAVAAAIVVTAGAYQFAPLKSACLTHCRNPLSFFLSRWRDRPPSAFWMGLQHGAFCVGCCWALMATMLITGVTSLAVMIALAVLTLLEQAAPHGHRVRAAVGIVLIVTGLASLVL